MSRRDFLFYYLVRGAMAKPDIKIYLSGKEKARKRKRWFRAAALVFFCAYLFSLLFCLAVFRAGFLRAKEIKISGNNRVAEADIITALQAQIFGGSYVRHLLGFRNFLIWPEEIEDPGRFLPQIKSMEVKKYYWKGRIEVSVTEREPYGIWCSGEGAEECFWFDDEGYILRRGFRSEGSIIKSVNDYSGRTLGLGGVVLAGNFFANLKSAFDALEKSGINPRYAELRDLGLEEISVKTSDGPVVKFSLRFPAGGTEDILTMLRSSGSFGKLQYVDLRVQNRAYYK